MSFLTKHIRAIVGATLVASFAACTTPYLESAPAQTVCVQPGQVFRITLAGNPTTGFLWRMQPTENIEIVAEKFEVPNHTDGRVGVPGLFHFDLRAKHSGEVSLLFRYERSWEKEENATIRTYRVLVRHP